MHHFAETARMRRQRVDNRERVGKQKDKKYRNQRNHGFFDAAKVHHRQQQDADNRERQFVRLPLQGKKTENRVRSAGDGNRDREHIINQKRATRYHSGFRREELARDQVSASARGKKLDDLGIAGADQKHRERRTQRDKNTQVDVSLQRQKRLFRTIAGGRKTVRTEPYPGKKSDERQVVKYRVIQRAFGFADDGAANFSGKRFFFRSEHPEAFQDKRNQRAAAL